MDRSSSPMWGECESAVEEEASSKVTGTVTDVCRDEADNTPPLQPHTLKQFEQHLNDLKKENFSLKLRIYFLEERIQQKYEESSEDVFRTNIELKVEVESLKQELQEKQQLLDKALTTAECLTNHNEEEVQRRCHERQQEIEQMQQVLETKIQFLQEEAQLARNEAVRSASLTGSHARACNLSKDAITEDNTADERPHDVMPSSDTNKDRMIEDLTKELHSKQALIAELSAEKKTLAHRVGALEGRVHELSSSLLQKDKDVEFYQEELGQERLRIEQEMQNLVEEQQSQLNQYECAAGQCVSELQKAQLQVQSLQAKIHESDSNNMRLQEKLNEMECELRSLRQAAQSQERTIQDLTESIGTKDSEAQKLYQLIEGQNVTLNKLREMAHRNQLAQSKAPEGVSESVTLSQLQGELVGVQSSLFSLGLELEASQRSLRQSQRQGDDLARFKDRLNADLQEALQHREETEKHNQDLRCTLQKTRAELRAKEEALKEVEAERLSVAQEKDRSIAQLNHSLREKERQLQEYSQMFETPESSKPRDALLEKLRERIKDRDRALERTIDDKFRCLDEREGQVRTLHLALREKDRDLDRLRCILSNNEETITSLDALVQRKELELEQAAEAYRNLQWLKQESEEKERSIFREKDAIIGQLQAALQARSKEIQDLTATLVARVQAGPTEVVEELKARLQLKEKLFQDLLSDRSRQSSEHQTRVSDLLNTLSVKDQYLQDNSYRLSLVISERTGQLQEVRRQLSKREQELCELRRDKERETGGDVQHLQGLLREKEAFFKEMMQNQEEVMMQPSPESEEDMKALQEELQLMLKKEREAQKELSALRSSLAAQQAKGAATASTEHVLEQLVLEYRQLNGALRTEKRLYQNLIHTNSDRQLCFPLNSSDKVLALHTQLDSVQALRGQLEEVLTRIQNMALDLERATKRQRDLGDVSTEEDEGDDEDGSSDEFTDSIEDDEKVTPASLPFTEPQTARGHEGESAFLRTRTQTVELELKEIQSQLEREGFTSVTQMRSTLQRLRKENQFLKEHQGVGTDHRSLDQGEEEDDTEEEDYMEDDERGATSSVPVKGLSEHSARLCSENRELQERLMVSEATVHAQAEQLKDYRDLLKLATQMCQSLYPAHTAGRQRMSAIVVCVSVKEYIELAVEPCRGAAKPAEPIRVCSGPVCQRAAEGPTPGPVPAGQNPRE
ncbi:myomegalin [Hippocampus comes]|uniref:myomegalin n=1 Tax=Hippocampus comes TaxID=109280 RepID=UPI00094EF0A3|nr:PREDICTED: myomegalin-like [Hippocampus comes]